MAGAEARDDLNGFSKRNAVTGWRLGYLVAPAASCAFQKMQQDSS